MSDVFQPEQVVGGRYRVVRKLGGGGMADVYLCQDLTLGRHVAVKVLLQRYLNDPTFVERFRREAKAAAGLNQQNLVAIYDWGELDGTYYIVMEYVEGETLKDLIRRRDRLSGNESVAVTLQLLAAVDFAHRSGIVHRDIKPQNVMLDRDGTVKVMDFGIARAGDSGMTEAGSILGTAQYLAPEQAKGQPVDERSDLYSVGVVLYEMLTGTVPFKGDSAVTVALKHVNEVPREPSELVPGMPYALNQIVLKAMAKDPADRYQSAAAFARDLRAAKEGGPVQAAAFDAGGERTRVMGAAAMTAAGTTSVLDQPTPPRRKKSKWPLVLVILLLAIIAAVAVALWWTMSGDKVAVPSVVGLSKAAAVKALEKDGFKAGVQEEYSDRVAAGFVSRQAPTSGTKLRAGATVDIWVSKGSAEGCRPARLQGVDRERRRRLADAERPAGRAEDRQVEHGRRGSGVQAGPVGRAPSRQARRHRHLLGEQRQAAGDGARPDQPDADRRRDGADRRWAQTRHRLPEHEHDGAGGLRHQPGPGGRPEGGQGIDGEHRRLHGLTIAHRDAIAESERRRRGRAQRLRHAVHDRGVGAQRGRPHRCVPREEEHRPGAGHGGEDQAGRGDGRSGGVDGAARHRLVAAHLTTP